MEEVAAETVKRPALSAVVVGEEAVRGVPRPLMAPMLEPPSSSKSSPSVEPRKSFGEKVKTFKSEVLRGQKVLTRPPKNPV